MTYQELLAHIYGRGRFGMKPGLERVREMLARLGNPEQRLRGVQIAGTNGKGSTGAFLSAIMTAAGHRTALFSSPHLSAFTERFRIDGVEASEGEISAAAERVLAAAPPDATFFEIATAIAAVHFADAGVELAVLETGMGGRWDATTALSAELAVITPVSRDHCDYLGETLAQIAAEKAGIIRDGLPVVVGPQEPEALEVIRAVAAERNAPCHAWGADFTAERRGDRWCYRDRDGELDRLVSGLAGRYQGENLAVAVTTARLLGQSGLALSDGAIRAGLAAARWPGRMELFDGPPRILLDGAHNRAGALALAESLADLEYDRLILVAGVMADKEWRELLQPLLPLAERVIAVATSLERALPAEELAAFCRGAGVDAAAAGGVPAGMALAARSAGEHDLVVVCGSLFVVGEARAGLTGREFMPIRG